MNLTNTFGSILVSRIRDHKKKRKRVKRREGKRLGWLKGMPDVDFVGIGASVWKKWRFSEMKRRKDHQYSHEPNTENLVVGMHAYK